MTGSFTTNWLATQQVSPLLVRTIRRVGEMNGRLPLLAAEHLEQTNQLNAESFVRSTESSNRIEGIVTTQERLHSIVSVGAEPISRPEQEIAGYRDILQHIRSSHAELWPTPTLLLEWHAQLYRYVPDEGGTWKTRDNAIIEIAQDGSRKVRFQPVSAEATPAAIVTLHEAFDDAWDAQTLDRLLLIPAYILDFLCIHPFRDGNGRLSRLLTLLLLYRAGFHIGDYIAPEALIERHLASYYDSIHRSNQGWHESAHVLGPWWDFFIGIMLLESYQQFEERLSE